MALPLPTTLTPSKVGKFVSCPLAFRYSYIERIPEPMFGGTRERLSVVPDDEPVPDDAGDQN